MGRGEAGGGPRLAALLSLAWPVVLSRSAQAVIGFCDALMTAPLGEDALAATTTGSLNCLAILILPMGVAFIVQSFAAQLSAKDDLESARRYGWYGVMLALISGLLSLALIPLAAVAAIVAWRTGGKSPAGDPGTLEDILSLLSIAPLGVEGVIVGRALYDGTVDLAEALLAIGPERLQDALTSPTGSITG